MASRIPRGGTARRGKPARGKRPAAGPPPERAPAPARPPPARARSRVRGRFPPATHADPGRARAPAPRVDLAEREVLFRLFTEHSGDLLSVLDEDARFVYASPSFERLLGHDAPALQGRDALELVHPEDRKSFGAALEAAWAGAAEGARAEVRLRGADGAWRWVEGTAHAATLHDGRRRVLCVARDVTERKETEDALQGSEVLFRLIAEHSADVIGVMDEEGRYLYVSPAIQRMLGRPPEDYVGRQALEFLHPDDLAWASQEFAKAAAGDAASGVVRTLHADGSWRWVEGSATFVQAGDGARRIISVGRDVTERVRAEEARARDEDRLKLYREIFARSNDGIAIIDPQGSYVEQNPAHRALIGYEDEELRGRTPAIHLGEEAFARVLGELAEKGRFRAELTSRRKDGAEVPVELSSFSLLDERGRVVCHVGIERDMTERRRTDTELRHRLEQLQAIYQLSAAAGKAGGGEALHEAAFDAIRVTLDAERAAILLFDQAGVMRFRAWRGLSEAYRAAVEGHSPWSRDATDPRPVLVPDVERDPSLQPLLPVLRREGVRALAFFPLVDQGRLLGKLMVYHGAPHAFPPDEVHVAETLATHVAGALARRRAVEALDGQVELLRFSEERFRSLSACSPVGIFLTDTVGRVTYTNPRCQAICGFTEHEALGRGWAGFLHADDRAPVAEAWDRTAAEGGSLDVECRFAHPAEGVHWVHIRSAPLVSSTGALLGHVGTVSDFTERKRGEEERAAIQRRLALEEARLKAIVDQMPAGLIVADAPSGRLLFGNDQVARIWRHPFVASGSVAEYRAYRGFHADGRPYEPEEWPLARAILRGEVTAHEEVEIERGDGSRGIISINAAPIKDGDGRVIAGVASFTDVTEARRSEHELQRQGALLKSISDNAASALVTLDLEGRVVFMNPAGEAMTGYALEEARGRVLHELVHQQRRDGTPLPMEECPIMQAVYGHKPLRDHEDAFRRRDGGWVDIACSVSPLGPAGPSTFGAVLEVRDITARKRTERELREANERLRELDRLKTQFLNTVAHELRTPLTPITLQVELLKQGLAGDDRQRRNLTILDRNMQRLSTLVEDILDVARLQSKRLTLHPTPLDLDRLVGEVAETFQEPAKRASIALEVRRGQAGIVHADPHRIGQVLFNLLSNAMKFTPAGGRVTLETARRGSEAVVRVADTGAGLEPDQLARLFQPFSQVHDHAAGAHAGSGLGLYISRGIVEQHGGRIWAESPGAGQGATFSFALPMQGPPAPTVVPQDPDRSPVESS